MLCTGRDEKIFGAIERLNGRMHAKCCLGDRDGKPHDEIVAVSNEARVRSHFQMDEQISAPAAARTRCTSTGETKGLTPIDPTRHIDGQGDLLTFAAFATARGARGDDNLAEPATSVARHGGDHLAEQALANTANRPGAAAVGARDGLRAAAGA